VTALAPLRQHSFEGIRARLDELIARGDLCGYLFNTGTGPDTASLCFEVSEISPSARGLWSDYIALRLNSHDPVSRQVHRRVSPLAWVLSDLSEGGSTDLADLVETHGFHCGVSVPIFGPAGLNGTMVVLSDRDHWQEDRLEATLKDAALLAMRLADEVRSQAPATAERKLTTREIECLRWMAAGKTSSEIATILNIAPRTVDFHAENSMRKLDCVSRQHAVSYAVRQRYF
jgi:LuxR family quorum-sensing transcriptional regulator LasR